MHKHLLSHLYPMHTPERPQDKKSVSSNAHCLFSQLVDSDIHDSRLSVRLLCCLDNLRTQQKPFSSSLHSRGRGAQPLARPVAIHFGLVHKRNRNSTMIANCTECWPAAVRGQWVDKVDLVTRRPIQPVLLFPGQPFWALQSNIRIPPLFFQEFFHCPN